MATRREAAVFRCAKITVMNATLTAPATQTGPLSAAQVEHFMTEGWTLAEAVVPAGHVELLRGGAQRSIDRIHAEMDRAGSDVLGINHRGKRYFSSDPSLAHQALYDFIYSPLMAGICRQLLGDQVNVFWEQYVVKTAEGGHAFAWHQDSGYVAHEHPRYLTCWVALDDMSEENGTISVLPFGRAPRRGLREPHRQDPQLNDLVGYDGPDPGELVCCPTGSIALFTSLTLHRSGCNRTRRQRRVYLIQYSAGVIAKPDGEPWGRTECFLRDGVVVGERRTTR